MLKLVLLWWSLSQTQSDSFRDPLQVQLNPAPVVLLARVPAPDQTQRWPRDEHSQWQWTTQTSSASRTATLTVVP